MDPLRSLEEDNVVLSCVVEALQDFAAELAEDQGQGASHLKHETTEVRASRQARLLAFLEALCRLSHNEKEDSLLLPAMVQAGCAWDRGPVAQARETHLRQSHLLSVLNAAALQSETWSQSTTLRVRDAIAEYTDILARSISDAHDSLYPVARQTLPPAQLKELGNQLTEFDSPSANELGRSAQDSGEWIEKLSLPPPAYVA